MRIPLEWLKEYINIKISLQKLADKLTMSGTEVESLNYGRDFENIVAGEIINIKKHLNASKLQIAGVNIGNKTIQIVCGATNIEVGQKVPVALVGAQLGEFEIKKTNIRGIESEGIICSEAELGFSDDNSGIMVLDPRAKVGSNISSALEIGGVVLDAEITPNRGDLLSILGIARELGSVLNQKVKEPEIVLNDQSSNKIKDNLKVEIKDFNLCPHYVTRMLELAEIPESPKWLQDRISSYGIRPLNAVVDITNYVMVETGQPLHVFDSQKIKDQKIIVRKAKYGEKIKTLDGVERKLSRENTVIADSEKPIAIAGVMGGANSEVDLSTKFIVLESAKFNKVNTRRTGNSIALRTEAVLRFEKEVPFELQEIALNRACQLLQQICGAKIYKGKIDLYKNKPKQKNQALQIKKVEKVLGIKIAENKIIKILKSLGFQLVKENKGVYNFLIPWWRIDVTIPEDLIEEIARIYGYDKIPDTLPGSPVPKLTENRDIKWLNVIKNSLVSLGFDEINTYSFLSEELLKKVNSTSKDFLKIDNPLTPDHEYMRQSLIPNILEITSKNIKNFDHFKIFEIAQIYLSTKNKLPKEERRIVGSVVGEGDNSFYAAKNIVNIILQGLGIFYNNGEIEISPIKPDVSSNIFHLGRTARLKINGQLIGLFGEVDSRVLTNFSIKKRIGLFDLNLDELINFATLNRKYMHISKYPPSRLDLAIIINKKILEAEIKQTIVKTAGNILYKIDLFDIYTGSQLKKGKKSLAYHLTLQSCTHTLSEKELNGIRLKIIKALRNKHKAEIREK
jgi:phenylalanyl-tRNA synthetase beta chain